MLGLRIPISLLLFFAVVLSTISSVMGQRVAGDVVGTVRDTSSAVIADANVRLIHQDTSQERSIVTDSSGVYRASTMEIGLYTVEATKPGFKTVSRRNIELHVNEVLRIDLTMEVGDVTERVEVTGEAPVVPTETGEISNLVDARQVVNLPLNGRNFMQLGMINPGVNQKNYSGSGGFSSNGLPSVYTNVQLDSAEIMDFSDQSGQIGVLANFAPSVDAIAEFTMQTSS